MSESIGWPAFFVLAVFLGLPGLYMVWKMRVAITKLTQQPAPA
jgi:hypothetical protein